MIRSLRSIALLAPALLALASAPAAAQITLDIAGGVAGDDLTATLAGPVTPGQFVIVTFADTTGPLAVGTFLPGEPGFWDQDITMFSYPAFLQSAPYTNPIGVLDLSTLSTSAVGATVFSQAWTAPGPTSFLDQKSNVVTVIVGGHGFTTPTHMPPLSPHAYANVVQLTNGNVLVTGGGNAIGGTPNGMSEVYDYRTSTFSLTTNQALPRAVSAAVRMLDGRVLITGGLDAVGAVTNSCEIFDPATGTFSVVNSMATGRALHGAALLNDGRVIVTGGSTNVSGADPVAQLLAAVSSATNTAEVYNPTTGLWANLPGMGGGARTAHITQILPDGRVLIAGGVQPGFLGIPTFLTSASRYNPVTNLWNATASMGGSGRAISTAVRLANGRVLVSGGLNANLIALSASALPDVSVYDNATNTWQNGPNMGTARYTHSATLMPDGTVLVAGGVTGTVSSTVAPITLATCALLTTGNVWLPMPSMSEVRAAHGAVRTPDGERVILIGGANDVGAIDPGTAELYVP